MEQNQNPTGSDPYRPAPQESQNDTLPAADFLPARFEAPTPPDEPPPARIPCFDGHLPDIVDPLVPPHPETVFTETKRLRHDGWTPAKQKLFLERLAECGIVREACQAAEMSARAAYNLRDRDPLFAAGWEAASTLVRPRLADEVYARAMNGVLERIYKDGTIVAERHRYDNRLTMSVLARLDARADRAEERGAPHLRLVARWDDYLAALGEDRRDDGLALLAGPAPAPAPNREVHKDAGDRELHELRPGQSAAERDGHGVWEDDYGWWTDYPPPAGFDGDEHGSYGDSNYQRALSAAEQAVIDADEAEERAAHLALAEAQRDAYFELAPQPAGGELREEDLAPPHPAQPDGAPDHSPLAPPKCRAAPTGDLSMSIFGSIRNAIFGHRAAPAQAQAQPQHQAQPQPSAMPQMQQQAPTGPGLAGAAAEAVDVDAVLAERARSKGQALNYQSSIVDLMKLLDLDSSLTARKELAGELGYTGEKDGSAEMNIWLHRRVMEELEKSGGRVSEALRH